jgi:DNA-directed RNA polymerase alpha subunit
MTEEQLNSIHNGVMLIASVIEQVLVTHLTASGDENLSRPIKNEAEFPASARTRLRNAGFAYVSDLINTSERQLENMRNMGDTTISVAKEILKKYGYTLRK